VCILNDVEEMATEAADDPFGIQNGSAVTTGQVSIHLYILHYVLGYDVKLHPAVLHLLSSLCRSLRRSLALLRYW